MTEETKEPKNSEETNAAGTAQATGTKETDAKSAQPKTASKKENDEAAKLKEQIKKLEEELAAANDKYLRMIAEYDNFRKRSAKERETVYTDAIADAVENILPIGDNLARAAQFTDPESVSKGIAMMEKSFVEALGKMGISEIEAQGQPFDPELHSAVMHVEDENVGENTVVEVFQRGYRRGDKVIRYAMVKVAN